MPEEEESGARISRVGGENFKILAAQRRTNVAHGVSRGYKVGTIEPQRGESPRQPGETAS